MTLYSQEALASSNLNPTHYPLRPFLCVLFAVGMELSSLQHDMIRKVMVLKAEELCPNTISSLLAMILFISNQHKTDSKYMISSCVDRQISLWLSEPKDTGSLFVQ